MNKKWIILFCAVLFFFLGYIRDEFFVQTNYWLGYLLNPDTEYVKGLKYCFFFAHFSYDALYYTKYVATFVFVFLYWLLSAYGVCYFFSSNQHFLTITKWYVGLFVFSLFIFLSGFIIFDIHQTYSFSRFIAGILQSPILCFIYILSHKISLQKV